MRIIIELLFYRFILKSNTTKKINENGNCFENDSIHKPNARVYDTDKLNKKKDVVLKGAKNHISINKYKKNTKAISCLINWYNRDKLITYKALVYIYSLKKYEL